MTTKWLVMTVMGAATLGGGGCAHNTTAPAARTQVASVVPVGGATGVDPTQPVTVTFSGPMQAGMEMYVALHEGGVTGPVVPGSWSWSDGRAMLTFTPSSALKLKTSYTLHLGGHMLDANGDSINYESCVQTMGGEWATQQMMGGMMADGEDEMGAGWQNANGSYGMVFVFTTG